eukprot:Gregarina_sp_Poly_1__10895@NODE_84_length_15393_cov_100_561529_g72_i0_p7_GENE_NODE_84_length_15393_cov_100_561529_g72_i0NODE_84_length_15393_cov_100_561529_g72_i0_p7_ORF_typecomplete_len242_score17_47_NODE_84_length_15393_cov_100_561529_g72_i025623287
MLLGIEVSLMIIPKIVLSLDLPGPLYGTLFLCTWTFLVLLAISHLVGHFVSHAVVTAGLNMLSHLSFSVEASLLISSTSGACFHLCYPVRKAVALQEMILTAATISAGMCTTLTVVNLKERALYALAKISLITVLSGFVPAAVVVQESAKLQRVQKRRRSSSYRGSSVLTLFWWKAAPRPPSFDGLKSDQEEDQFLSSSLETSNMTQNPMESHNLTSSEPPLSTTTLLRCSAESKVNYTNE